LAKRLINSNSVSDDSELTMITGLKHACGYEYTSKLQRMFTDVGLSYEMNERFKEYIAAGHPLDVDLSVMILTSGTWPIPQGTPPFNIPIELERCLDQFHNYYNSVHRGRKLTWLHHLSKGEVKTNHLKKRYELQGSTYQIGVLLLFNWHANQKTEKNRSLPPNSLSVDEIENLTGLKDPELSRTIQTLVASKILTKDPSEVDEVDKTDVITLNSEFASKRLKVKIPAAPPSATDSEQKDTHKAIEEDRKFFLQAALVRIMKARKVHTHNGLVQEVIEQSKSRFQPSVPLIKKCIDALIEKEYLRRVEGDSNKYSYVA